MSMRRTLTGGLLALGVTAALLTTTAQAPATASAPAAAAAAASAATPQTVRVVTANIDFNISSSRVKKDWAKTAKKADVVLFQEARDVNLHKIINRKFWVVRHDTSTSSTRGTAIAVRRSAAAAVGKLRLSAATGSSLGCPGGGIGKRYMALVDVRLNNGEMLNLISVHMPPKRCWGTTYNQAAAKVIAKIKQTRKRTGRIIVAGDWNKVVRKDPSGIGRKTGLKPRGVAVSKGQPGIDGFFVPKGMQVRGPWSLPKGNSDHRAVRMIVTIA